MDINDLLHGSPELGAALGELGLDTEQIRTMGEEVRSQLLGENAGDLGRILDRLGARDFLDRIDVQRLAARVGIDRAQALAALSLIAPRVAAFSRDLPGLQERVGKRVPEDFMQRIRAMVEQVRNRS